MPSIKLDNFKGLSPKVASELLPDSFAQDTLNVKLSSGDLIPYRQPVVVDSTVRTVNVKTIHALKNPSTNALVWLSFTNDVDIVTASDSSDDEQRFYYTGEAEPRVSNLSATSHVCSTSSVRCFRYLISRIIILKIC